MSKELKPCHLLDRLREWFELYGNQNHERAEEELHLAIDELYKYQQKDQKIADLEAKLAEKDQELNDLCQNYDFQLNDFSREIYRLQQREKVLEQQLAEKDKLIEFYINSGKEQCEEINKINHQALTYCDEIDNLTNQLAEKEKEIDKLEDKLHHYYEETLNKGICGLCDHLRGEYKADFAIAQLEKVKEWLEPKYFDYEQIDYLTKIINLQIKELKEKK